MRFKLTNFRVNETGARRALGDLEAEIMEHMWACDCASVRDVHEKVRDRPLAYTTVMTVMTRLAVKGLLDKEKEGKHYKYRTTVTRIEFEESVASSLLNGMTGSLGASALASFVGGIDDEDTLRELELLIHEKRRQR